MRRQFAVGGFAVVANRLFRASRRAAVAVLGFRVALVAGADAGVRAVAVRGPCAVVVTKYVAGCKGRFVGSALGACSADRAGLVVDRFFRTGRGGFQIRFFGGFCREAVRRQFAVGGFAVVANRLFRTGRRAAVAVLGFRVACVTGADAGVRVVTVRGPCAVVVAQRFAILEGPGSLRVAGGAGLIVHCRAGAGRGGLQSELVQLIDEMVRAKLTIRMETDLAERRGKAVGRAALMRAAIDLQMAAGVESPVAVGIGLPFARLFGVVIRVLFSAFKSRFAGRSLGGLHTDLAGFVIDRRGKAVCSLAQTSRNRNFPREVVFCDLLAAGVAEVVIVLIGVVENIRFRAADSADVPMIVSVDRPAVIGAVVIFNMGGIVGADALVHSFLFVGRPVTPVVAEHVAGCKGRLVGSALGACSADGAGFVIHRPLGAGRGSLQIRFLCVFRREAVRLQRTVGLAAVVADSLRRAGRRAAGVLAEGDALGNAEPIALRCRGRGDKPEAGFSRYVGSGRDRPRAEAVDCGDGFAVARADELIGVGGVRAALGQDKGERKVLCAANGVRAGDGQ